MIPTLHSGFVLKLKAINVASFSEVSGLQIEMETESYREGGVNGFVHTFPKGIKYQPLVLKRGITDLAMTLWNWYKDVSGRENFQEKRDSRFDGVQVWERQKALDLQRSLSNKMDRT